LSGTVLITGATGQVGNAIARRLAADGVQPRALVRSPERAQALPEGAQPVFGDVTDAPSLRAALDGCATVYHAAGIPEQWRRDAGEFTRVNVEGTRNVVEAALAAGVERFVYTSTDDVLVQGPGQPYDESKITPNQGDTPYQRSKLEADRIVTAALDRGLPAVFLHPAGLYGPAPFLVKGLNDLLMQLAKRKTPMLLPGGMGVAYSDDVADGHVRAAAEAAVGSRYLLAESFQSLTDIARAVAASEPSAKVPRVMPLGIARVVSTVGERVAQVTGRPPMISRSVLLFLERGTRPSGARARNELGWSPTPFPVGVERTLAHFRQQGWM
jgi:dihydroflavonol-4-reductase